MLHILLIICCKAWETNFKWKIYTDFIHILCTGINVEEMFRTVKNVRHTLVCYWAIREDILLNYCFFFFFSMSNYLCPFTWSMEKIGKGSFFFRIQEYTIYFVKVEMTNISDRWFFNPRIKINNNKITMPSHSDFLATVVCRLKWDSICNVWCIKSVQEGAISFHQRQL